MRKFGGIGTALSPTELRATLQGPEAFVCTPFDEGSELDIDRFRTHLRFVVGAGPQKPAGCFVACGSGEFFSLTFQECKELTRAAADEIGGEVPVVAGVGYGTRMAVELARAAEEQGADGVLVFPPYLTSAPQEGLYEHFRAIAQSIGIGVIVYNRDNAILDVETILRLSELPNVIGIKDGHGDIEKLKRIRAAAGVELLLINGMPSAEIYASAYLDAGIVSYSSGLFDFLPELTWAFYHALTGGDKARVAHLLDFFYRPYIDLRNLVPGYGISLVKAGARLTGRPLGGVRPPLVDPTPEHEAALKSLVERAQLLM